MVSMTHSMWVKEWGLAVIPQDKNYDYVGVRLPPGFESDGKTIYCEKELVFGGRMIDFKYFLGEDTQSMKRAMIGNGFGLPEGMTIGLYPI